MLFVSSIVVPTGLSAASLTCDMEISHSVPVCCATADMNNHQEENKESQDCKQQAFCEQVIGSNPSDVPAVTQNTKIAKATKLLLEELTTIQDKSVHTPPVKDESLSLHYHPPIFLLNSTFLN